MVALLQADGRFGLEDDVGCGDGNDLFRAGFKAEISPTTTPNTNGYQDGAGMTTTNTASDISATGRP